MLSFPRTTFTQTPETEIERLVHAAIVTGMGFYWYKGFAVLPRLIAGNPACVYLPDLNWQQYPDIWAQLRSIDYNFPLKIPEDIGNFVSQKYQSQLEDQIDISSTTNNWKKVESKFWEILSEIFPQIESRLDEIEVRVTRFGTVSSYQHLRKSQQRKMICYFREDSDISHLVEIILTGLLYSDILDKKLSWQELDGWVDLCMTKTKLGSIFSHYKSTLNSIEQLNSKYYMEADTYYHKLELHFGQPFQIKKGEILLNNKNISSLLSPDQQKLCQLFVGHSNQVVDYDQLADCLYSKEDDFSLWAINKQVQRLRQQLISLGCQEDCLVAIRGVGYCLVNTPSYSKFKPYRLAKA